MPALYAATGRTGCSGVAMPSIAFSHDGAAMSRAAESAEEKTVFVRDYLRFRNGKWEDVSSHFRRPRRKRADN